MRFNIDSKTLVLTLIPSYTCNLACAYCLQGKDKIKNIITNENLQKVLKFFKKKIKTDFAEEKIINKIVVRFYGGEPLLHKHILQKFCEETYGIALKYKLPIIYQMPMNLTILDDDLIKIIKKYKISIQVTIDGTKNSHDARRITKDGKGTYDLIIENLIKIINAGLKKNITIRINIDEKNIIDAEQCLTNLRSYSDDIYFGLLTSYVGLNDEYSSLCIECDKYSDIMTNNLNTLIVKNLNEPPMMFGKGSPCSLCSENKFFIDDTLNVIVVRLSC